MRPPWLIVVAVAAAGCSGVGGQKIVPVSGKVTLNGKPLVNATVSFQPVAPEGSINAGPASVGKTNDKGEFSMVTLKGDKGAQVGKHRVLISSQFAKAAEDDSRPQRGGPEQDDLVPRRYGMGQKDEIVFEVPAGGTDKADFPLTSP
jgi:hypothetical protein